MTERGTQSTHAMQQQQEQRAVTAAAAAVCIKRRTKGVEARSCKRSLSLESIYSSQHTADSLSLSLWILVMLLCSLLLLVPCSHLRIRSTSKEYLMRERNVRPRQHVSLESQGRDPLLRKERGFMVKGT